MSLTYQLNYTSGKIEFRDTLDSNLGGLERSRRTLARTRTTWDHPLACVVLTFPVWLRPCVPRSPPFSCLSDLCQSSRALSPWWPGCSQQISFVYDLCIALLYGSHQGWQVVRGFALFLPFYLLISVCLRQISSISVSRFANVSAFLFNGLSLGVSQSEISLFESLAFSS